MASPVCIVKGCDRPGTKRAVVDIGPTAGDALVPDEERKHKVWLCDGHHARVSPPFDPGDFSIGTRDHAWGASADDCVRGPWLIAPYFRCGAEEKQEVE